MAGSSTGTILKVTTFGESHGPAIGAVLDGFPAGMELDAADIQVYLDRRRPGQSAVTTGRREADAVEILSGVFEGRTTGTPIALVIRNTDQHSGDYRTLAHVWRPGHADYTLDQKFGFRDYRGGGRSSGRETAARVAAGAIAEKFLKEMGIDFCFYTRAIGDVCINPAHFDRGTIPRTPTAMPDAEADEKAQKLILEAKERRDSLGGVVEGRITGVPAGIGDPVFHKLDAMLGGALFSIGAVKEVGIGDGAAAAGAAGSTDNDGFGLDGDGKICKTSNHAGGILGGISDGSPIIIRAYFKPTPSIASPQQTLRSDGTPTTIEIAGRHDPVIVPRAVVVCETMCALVLLDAMLVNMSARADRVQEFYRR